MLVAFLSCKERAQGFKDSRGKGNRGSRIETGDSGKNRESGKTKQACHSEVIPAAYAQALTSRMTHKEKTLPNLQEDSSHP
ncbi:MAG: hypothetical protein AMJ92_09590 [candidate division Zixibacteria bacterium SM23_81]|nr:MAG: hypothetical protein AMJ92_09590 [candidate division Zixibacteria bacterium SM23_81]